MPTRPDPGTSPVTAHHPVQVAVVIPSFNCAGFLAAAIESVLAQSLPGLEVVVVDDGSTDQTAAVVAPYLGRVRFLQQQNQGLASARNTGIRATRAPFIALLDADDIWHRHKLARQMPRFADAAVGIVYSDFSVRYADGRVQPSYLVNRPLASEGYVFEQYIASRFLFPSTMVFRRECLETCGLFDEEMRASEDIELFARILLRWQVALAPEPLMVRYEGTHNLTADAGKLSRYTILALRKILAKEPLLPAPARQAVCRELAQQYAWSGYASFHKHSMAAARRSLVQAMRYDPRRLRSCLRLLAASFLPAPVLGHLQRRRLLRSSPDPQAAP